MPEDQMPEDATEPEEPQRDKPTSAGRWAHFELLGVVLMVCGATAFLMAVWAYLNYYGTIAGTLLYLIVAGVLGGPALGVLGLVMYAFCRLMPAEKTVSYPRRTR